MNKYSISMAVAVVFFLFWYRGHSAYNDGYTAGQAEKYQEMLKSQNEKNIDLYASNAYLSAQIDGMQNMLDDRNESIKSLAQKQKAADRKINEAMHRNEDWSCSDIPHDVAGQLRTNTDSREASPSNRACTGAAGVNRKH